MHASPLVPETIAGFLAKEVKSWWPQHIDESVWLEHTPFAAWLMDTARPEVLVELGTYRAVSYLAFCQAARQMARPTRCFAVDTWHENMHTGALRRAWSF